MTWEQKASCQSHQAPLDRTILVLSLSNYLADWTRSSSSCQPSSLLPCWAKIGQPEMKTWEVVEHTCTQIRSLLYFNRWPAMKYHLVVFWKSCGEENEWMSVFLTGKLRTVWFLHSFCLHYNSGATAQQQAASCTHKLCIWVALFNHSFLLFFRRRVNVLIPKKKFNLFPLQVSKLV